MQSEILSKKTTFKKNNEEIVDLTSCSLRYTDDNVIIIDEIYVSDDTAMRPDLISVLTYGQEQLWDYILKYNAISNPFSIDSGDFLVIPEPTKMATYIVSPIVENDEDSIRAQYVDASKKPNEDPKYANYVKMMQNTTSKYRGREATGLPPNIANRGESEISIENNQIILGPNITKSKS